VKTVFFDVDTQIDFMFPSGALYVPGAETILDRVAALNRYAVANSIPLISTMDAHTENDAEFQIYPHHCVAGTLGQRKPAATLVGQIFVEKQKLDCFSNPELPGLLARLGAERYVVYGVVTEICVKLAAMGLIRTGARVEIVSDAVRSLSDDAGEMMLAEFRAAGGFVTQGPAIWGQGSATT
jgi:nicotinamidase/pyrazinamidase